MLDDVEVVYIGGDGSIQRVVRWKSSLVAKDNLVEEPPTLRGTVKENYGAGGGNELQEDGAGEEALSDWSAATLRKKTPRCGPHLSIYNSQTNYLLDPVDLFRGFYPWSMSADRHPVHGTCACSGPCLIVGSLCVPSATS